MGAAMFMQDASGKIRRVELREMERQKKLGK